MALNALRFINSLAQKPNDLRVKFHPYPHNQLNLTGYPEQQLSEVCQLKRWSWVLDAKAEQESRSQLWFVPTWVQHVQNLLQDSFLLLQLVAYQSRRAF